MGTNERAARQVRSTRPSPRPRYPSQVPGAPGAQRLGREKTSSGVPAPRGGCPRPPPPASPGPRAERRTRAGSGAHQVAEEEQRTGRAAAEARGDAATRGGHGCGPGADRGRRGLLLLLPRPPKPRAAPLHGEAARIRAGTGHLVQGPAPARGATFPPAPGRAGRRARGHLPPPPDPPPPPPLPLPPSPPPQPQPSAGSSPPPRPRPLPPLCLPAQPASWPLPSAPGLPPFRAAGAHAGGHRPGSRPWPLPPPARVAGPRRTPLSLSLRSSPAPLPRSCSPRSPSSPSGSLFPFPSCSQTPSLFQFLLFLPFLFLPSHPLPRSRILFLPPTLLPVAQPSSRPCNGFLSGCFFGRGAIPAGRRASVPPGVVLRSCPTPRPSGWILTPANLHLSTCGVGTASFLARLQPSCAPPCRLVRGTFWMFPEGFVWCRRRRHYCALCFNCPEYWHPGRVCI